MKQFYSRGFAYFRAISLVLLACFSLQLSGPVVYAVQSDELDYSSSEDDFCVIDNDSDSDSRSGSDLDDDSSYDSDYDSDDDFVPQNRRQSFMGSERTFLWWVKVSLLLMLCLSGIYLPVAQAVSVSDVNQASYDVCHPQKNGMQLCFKLPREYLSVDPIDQCYRHINTTVPHRGAPVDEGYSISEKALTGNSIQACLFKENNPHGPFICLTASLDGRTSKSYNQQDDGSFVDQASSSFRLPGWNSLCKLSSRYCDSTITTEIAQEILAQGPQTSCALTLVNFADSSALRKEVGNLAIILQLSNPHCIDFSQQSTFCELIKTASQNLLKLTDSQMRALIAQTLAYVKLQRNIVIQTDDVQEESLPVANIIRAAIISNNLLPEYQEKPIEDKKSNCLLSWCSFPQEIPPFRNCTLLAVDTVNSNVKLTISSDAVKQIERLNFHVIADLLAGLATQQPAELARAFATLAALEVQGRRINIYPGMKPIDSTSVIKNNGKKNPLEIPLLDDEHRVATLLELQEEHDAVSQALEKSYASIQ
ncbi:hypothetical protein JST56_07675 [Candidatus Dependentiae bacterium]|nr:hypothetical protein [Candidatus Dependentiae bacterium]